LLEVSAHVGDSLLFLKIVGTLRVSRQLKHRRLLSLSQQREENDLPIRKLRAS
jgi:hypothetical protein